VSKMVAKDPARRRGVLFVNQGGPGGSAAAFAGSLSVPDASGYTRLSPDVLAVYDIVGMDPRGVAHSSPFSCVPTDYFAPPQPDPDAVWNRAALWRLWNGFSERCGRSTDMLPYVGTPNVARDMDRVRAALGEDKLSYLGFSYGTWIGALYGTLFPHRVERMILDSNVDPTPRQRWYHAALAQPPALQNRLDGFLAWAAKYDAVFGLGSAPADTRRAWNTVLADFRASPHRTAGANELLGLAYNFMFSETGWIPFAQALSDYFVRKDDRALVELATPATDLATERLNAIYNAVICVDAPWPRSKRTYERDTARIARTSQLAWYSLWSNGSACQNWPVHSGERIRVTGRGLPGVLLFNSVDDPATPYPGALRMHDALSTSVLVTERDSGKHGVFANARPLVNPNANRIGTDYLVTGNLPQTDLTIPGHPLPVP
jgi:pimeloyl-ACP methyl ester carboxylesterase